MVPDETLRRIVSAIYAQDELNGCMIGFVGNNQSQVLQEGFTPSVNYFRVMTMIEEAPPGAAQQVVVDGNSPGAPAIAPAPVTSGQPPSFVSNRSRLWPELRGTGLTCGFAVWSGVEVIGGVAAEAPSGGTSTVLVVLGWVGLGASTAQCGNAVVRTFQALAYPTDNSLQRWDQNSYYSGAALIVDAIGVVSSLPSIAVSTRNLLRVLERRGGLVAADQLVMMTRAERQARVLEALKRATRTREDQAAIEAAMREAGLTDREIARATQRGLGGIDNAIAVNAAISRQTARALTDSIKGVIMGTTGVGISATRPDWTGSASGSVYALIVHVIGDGN